MSTPYHKKSLEGKKRANEQSVRSRRKRFERDAIAHAGYLISQRQSEKNRPKNTMLYRAKVRARKKGVPFSVTIADFEIPDRCPVLGMKLVFGHPHFSPSLDRIIPALGYVPGNVIVMSARANRLKCDCINPAELRAVADWLDKELRGA